MAMSDQTTRGTSRDGTPSSLRSRQADLSIQDLYAIGRHLRIKESGFLGLYRTPDFHGLQESDAPELLKEAIDLCHKFHPDSTDIQQNLNAYRDRVLKYWYPPKPLVEIPGFKGSVFPDWKLETECRLDHTITTNTSLPMYGLPQILTRCAIQSVFAVATSSMAFLRVGDQRCSQDLVSKLSPLAHVVYAIQLVPYCRLKNHRERLSKLLHDQTLELQIFPGGFRNVHDIFQELFNGVASFSFHTSRLPFCKHCNIPIVKDNQQPRSAVERSTIFVSSGSTSNEAAVQSFFGTTKFNTDNTHPVIDLDKTMNEQDENEANKRRKVEEGASRSSVCQKCHRPSQGFDRQIVLDRLPYFLALGYDRGGLMNEKPQAAIPSTKLPHDWKAPLRLQNSMNLQGEILSHEYALAGAIISDHSSHYLTIWRGRLAEEPWICYDGQIERGKRYIVQEEDVPGLVDNPGKSVAAILVYKQINPGT